MLGARTQLGEKKLHYRPTFGVFFEKITRNNGISYFPFGKLAHGALDYGVTRQSTDPIFNVDI